MIYIVEDEAGIRELVVYTLKNSGFDVKGFSCGEEFWKAVGEKIPRLILLDIMLPGGEDGLEILKKLRNSKTTGAIPVMMLTAKGSEHDKVMGLDLGADDYLPKPFGMMEMVARVRSLLRRAVQNDEKEQYTVKNMTLDIPRHLVTVDGAEVMLTLKEFDLFTLLVKNMGIVFTRDKLLTLLWGFNFEGETRTVDVHIGTLRAKLGSAGELIQTVRGLGYKAGEPE